MANNLGWFKFWTKALHDHKIVELNDAAFRTLVTLWCLASESRTRGRVHNAQWKTVFALAHIESETTVRERLIGANLVTEDGLDIVITHWDEYQSVSSNALRQKRYRERNASVTHVTARNGRSRSRSRSRKEEDQNIDNAELPLPATSATPANPNGIKTPVHEIKSVGKNEVPDHWKDIDDELQSTTYLKTPKLRNWPWWDKMARLYEHNNDLDFLLEIRKMDEWFSRPKNQKRARTIKDWTQFASNWMRRAAEDSNG